MARGAGRLAHWHANPITVWPDGKPKVRVWECKATCQLVLTTNNTAAGMAASAKTPKVTDEGTISLREHTTDKWVKAVLEIPVGKKDDIWINTYGEAVELLADYPQKNAIKQMDCQVNMPQRNAGYNVLQKGKKMRMG